jgi:hypothetical protein
MKITEAQFNTAQKAFSERSLSGAQKEAMVKNIYAMAKEAPSKSVVSPISGYFFFYHKRMLSGFAMLLLLVTGTSYASASSLPGDALYAIKVRVLEPIGLAASLDEESKNEYRISLLQKRIDELQILKKKTVMSNTSQEKSAEATSRTIIDLERNSEHGGIVDGVRVAEKVRDYNALVDQGLSITTVLGVAVATGPVDEDEHAKTKTTASTTKETHEEKEEKEHVETAQVLLPEPRAEEVVPAPTRKGFFGL